MSHYLKTVWLLLFLLPTTRVVGYEVVKTFPLHKTPRWCRFDRGSLVILDGTAVKRWDPRKEDLDVWQFKEQVQNMERELYGENYDPQPGLQYGDISRDGKTLIAAEGENEVFVLDLPRLDLRRTLSFSFGHQYWGADHILGIGLISSDPDVLVLKKSQTYFFDLITGKPKFRLPETQTEISNPNRVNRAFAISPTASELYTGIAIWNYRESAGVFTEFITPDLWEPNLSASGLEAKLHEKKTRLIFEEKGDFGMRTGEHPSWIKHLAASPDGRFVAYSTFNEHVRIVEIPTGKTVFKFQLPPTSYRRVNSLAFSPKEGWLAWQAASYDKHVALYLLRWGLGQFDESPVLIELKDMNADRQDSCLSFDDGNLVGIGLDHSLAVIRLAPAKTDPTNPRQTDLDRLWGELGTPDAGGWKAFRDFCRLPETVDFLSKKLAEPISGFKRTDLEEATVLIDQLASETESRKAVAALRALKASPQASSIRKLLQAAGVDRNRTPNVRFVSRSIARLFPTPSRGEALIDEAVSFSVRALTRIRAVEILGQIAFRGKEGALEARKVIERLVQEGDSVEKVEAEKIMRILNSSS